MRYISGFTMQPNKPTILSGVEWMYVEHENDENYINNNDYYDDEVESWLFIFFFYDAKSERNCSVHILY